MRDTSIRKVLVIGSGPIVIGQAAEFDYAGTQACRALREEGVEVVLLNSNPATIMTDGEIADHVYIEPLTLETLESLILKDRPDSEITDIDATIICEKESHKGIVIGKGGSMLRRIGMLSRIDAEKMLERKVNLQLWVKVKKDWRDSDYLVKNYGYDIKEL